MLLYIVKDIISNKSLSVVTCVLENYQVIKICKFDKWLHNLKSTWNSVGLVCFFGVRNEQEPKEEMSDHAFRKKQIKRC